MASHQRLSESYLTDEQLVESSLRGKSDGFDELIKRYVNDAFRLANSILRNYSDAEDVTQDAFLKAYVSLDSFDPLYKFKSWILTITANTARDYLRRKYSRSEVPIGGYGDRSDGESAYIELLGEEESPDEPLIRKETQEIVADAVETLPEKYRTQIIQRFYSDLPYREIFQIARIPLGTVKSRQNSARRFLRKRLLWRKDDLGIEFPSSNGEKLEKNKGRQSEIGDWEEIQELQRELVEV